MLTLLPGGVATCEASDRGTPCNTSCSFILGKVSGTFSPQ